MKALSLHKISCTRQFESKLSLHSFALSLQKISCTRQFERKSFMALICIIFALLIKENQT